MMIFIMYLIGQVNGDIFDFPLFRQGVVTGPENGCVGVTMKGKGKERGVPAHSGKSTSGVLDPAGFPTLSGSRWEDMTADPAEFFKRNHVRNGLDRRFGEHKGWPVSLRGNVKPMEPDLEP
jgi:hypothetical protein